MRQLRVCVALLLAAALALPALAGQPEPSAEQKTFDEAVYKTLRDVINHGVELYNGGDHAGCYRVFEGALKTVGPLLTHRPELQKAITTGLASAEKDPIVWRRAFTLRGVLDKVRAEVGGQKPKDKEKLPPPQPNGKKKDDKKDLSMVQGTVTLDGKPVDGATITFVAGKVQKADTTSKDGIYSIKGLKPGEYKVTVKSDGGAAVPAKFGAAETSGLAVDVKAGVNTFDISLKVDKPEKKDDDKKNDEKKGDLKKDDLKKGDEKKDDKKKDDGKKDD